MKPESLDVFPSRGFTVDRSRCFFWACATALVISFLSSPVGAWARTEQELIHLTRQDCGSCHGMTFKGGLGVPLTPEALRNKPVDSLVATIMYGRPGTAMPPWQSILTESEALWIVRKLMDGFPEEKQ